MCDWILGVTEGTSVSSQNLYVKTLTFNSMVLRNGGFERELGHEGGAPMIGSVSSSERERREPTLSLPCEDTARTRLFAT